MNSTSKTGHILFLTLGLYTPVTPLLADPTGSSVEKPTLRPSTTLSAAANAAASAAAAADAAAAAANAAAAAAAAAVNAMNAILPPSQRFAPAKIAVPVINQTAAPAPGTGQSTITEISTPAKAIPERGDMLLSRPESEEPPVGNSSNFSPPPERSLVGLAGTFEVPVSVDKTGEFSLGVSRLSAQSSEPVEKIRSLNLAQAVKAALGFSRDILVASSKVDQAKAQTGQARAFLLPSLLVNMKGGREKSMPGAEIDPKTGKEYTSDTHSRTDKSIVLSQPIFDAPSFYDWKRRKEIEKSREAGYRSSQGDTYLSTVSAYLNLVSTRLLSEMAADYEKQLDDLFAYIDKRAAAGAASNADKERVRARNLSAHATRIEQDAAHAAAGVEFARVVNLAPDSLRLPDLEDLGASIVPRTVNEAMTIAVASNPEIQSLQAELEAADIDRTAALGKHLPKLNIEYSDSDSMHPGGQSDNQHDKRLMLVMNWALFSGGGDIQYGKEKAARRNEILYRLDDQSRRVLQTLSSQYAILDATRQRIGAGYNELESISSAAKAMSTRMVSGNQSLLDMLDVYDRFFQARTRLVTLHIQEMDAIAQIARVLQGAPQIESQDNPISSLATANQPSNGSAEFRGIHDGD